MNISELFDLHGRTVLVTGGSGVLGRVMASELAQAGARVAILGRREEPALAVAATIRAVGGEAKGCIINVASADLPGILLWLVSPASAFVTGVMIPVDGGFASCSGV